MHSTLIIFDNFQNFCTDFLTGGWGNFPWEWITRSSSGSLTHSNRNENVPTSFCLVALVLLLFLLLLLLLIVLVFCKRQAVKTIPISLVQAKNFGGERMANLIWSIFVPVDELANMCTEPTKIFDYSYTVRFISLRSLVSLHLLFGAVGFLRISATSSTLFSWCIIKRSSSCSNNSKFESFKWIFRLFVRSNRQTDRWTGGTVKPNGKSVVPHKILDINSVPEMCIRCRLC